MKCLATHLLAVLLAMPLGSLAAPLSAVPVGEYRPLKASETELVTEGFEASLLYRLGDALGREFALEEAGSVAPDLRLGAVSSGAVYYSSEAAALTSAQAGPESWSDLAGQAVCLEAGSPHDASMSRFGGLVRRYPSAAQALIGLKLGECEAVVADRVLLEQIAELPEWQRYSRLLPALENSAVTLRLDGIDPALHKQIESVLAGEEGRARLAEVVQHWIDEVAFQAYVLADTLDCH